MNNSASSLKTIYMFAGLMTVYLFVWLLACYTRRLQGFGFFAAMVCYMVVVLAFYVVRLSLMADEYKSLWEMYRLKAANLLGVAYVDAPTVAFTFPYWGEVSERFRFNIVKTVKMLALFGIVSSVCVSGIELFNFYRIHLATASVDAVRYYTDIVVVFSTLAPVLSSLGFYYSAVVADTKKGILGNGGFGEVS